MTPQTQPRKPRNSSKVNLMISLFFHSVIVIGLLYFAARQGLLGKKVKKIAVEMVKEKPPEKPKEPEKPKTEPPKIVQPKLAETPKPVETPKLAATPPPVTASPVSAPPVAAPPAVEVPSFAFEGGRAVESSSDPSEVYKGLIEYSLRSHWTRPMGEDDHTFVAEVEVAVDHDGQISDPVWKKSSGDKRWDDSVRMALNKTPSITRPPPKNFPPRVVIRFDVVAMETVAD